MQVDPEIPEVVLALEVELAVSEPMQPHAPAPCFLQQVVLVVVALAALEELEELVQGGM